MMRRNVSTRREFLAGQQTSQHTPSPSPDAPPLEHQMRQAAAHSLQVSRPYISLPLSLLVFMASLFLPIRYLLQIDLPQSTQYSFTHTIIGPVTS